MHRPFVAVLSSGSCGNSILFRSEETSVLVDAGISCRELERRMADFGTEPSDIDAVLLTHEHTDHNRGARRFCRTHDVPVFGTDGTLTLTPLDGARITPINRPGTFAVGGLSVRAFPVLHLAAEPVGYTITADGVRVSIASDLGCLTDVLTKEMSGADLLMIEANYDEHMLQSGGYPDFLKRTIAGDHGHLPNSGAATLCAQVAEERTKRIVLLHLSKDNNTPDLARGAVEESLRMAGRQRLAVVPTEHGCRNGPFRL
jgi:phosphoribosyl 1,2-cyclic phosphodiesterase